MWLLFLFFGGGAVKASLRTSHEEDIVDSADEKSSRRLQIICLLSLSVDLIHHGSVKKSVFGMGGVVGDTGNRVFRIGKSGVLVWFSTPGGGRGVF